MNYAKRYLEECVPDDKRFAKSNLITLVIANGRALPRRDWLASRKLAK
ncbi:hypothetical protein [Paraburkholderia sp. HD33-4]|nr:hypothetical protein [Paraburkholderia sp. HD33-4]